jgi:hypothetical protein
MRKNVPACFRFIRDTLRNEAIYSPEKRKDSLCRAIEILEKVEKELDTNVIIPHTPLEHEKS